MENVVAKILQNAIIALFKVMLLCAFNVWKEVLIKKGIAVHSNIVINQLRHVVLIISK